MVSTKPYLIRAIHEWCTDQGFTPYLAVPVDARTRVPREYVKDGQIVLNVARCDHQLQMGNEEITFQARFNGASPSRSSCRSMPWWRSMPAKTARAWPSRPAR